MTHQEKPNCRNPLQGYWDGALAADEIAELLAMDGSDLTEEQAAALRDFIRQIGGLENAYNAVELLSQLEKAA